MVLTLTKKFETRALLVPYGLHMHPRIGFSAVFFAPNLSISLSLMASTVNFVNHLDMEKAKRLIAAYNKNDDEWVADVNIDFIELDVLRNIFKPPSDDFALALFYNINRSKARLLQNYVDMEFDFKRFNYELECFLVPSTDPLEWQ